MKKAATLLLLILPFACYSQDYAGVIAGVGFSNMKGDDIAPGVSISNKITVNLGIKTELQFSEHWFLMCGIEYCGKGYKAKDATHTNNVTLSYIQLPFSALYKLPLDKDANNQLLFGAGPYVGFGIGYKSVWTEEDPVMGHEEGIESADFADMGMRITDFGFTALAGIQVGKRVQVFASYQPGLVNVFYSADFGLVKNRRAGLQLLYVF